MSDLSALECVQQWVQMSVLTNGVRSRVSASLADDDVIAIRKGAWL